MQEISRNEQRIKDQEAFERIVRQRQKDLFGERYVGVSLSQIRAGDQTAKIAEFCTRRKNFLIYCGSPGIGKTFLCAALIDWAMRNFQSFRYWKEIELLKRVRASIEEFKGDYQETLKNLLDDDLIFLDDIGSSGLNEWREEIFFSTIDQRYNSMKPTVITSNFSVAEMQKLYHKRISSRLFSHDSIVVELMNGIDLRKEGF